MYELRPSSPIPFNRQPLTPSTRRLSGTATQRIVGRSPPLRTQVPPLCPLLLVVVLRIPVLVEREWWCAKPHTTVAALDCAEIDPLTPGLVFAHAHIFLTLNLILLLLTRHPSIFPTAMLPCCCCLLRPQRKNHSLTLWSLQLLTVLHLVGAALQRQDLVRERTTRLHRFLRFAPDAAVVEDTAARAEFADAGVVLSADVAGLFGDAG
jgi:hypothetical protein